MARSRVARASCQIRSHGNIRIRGTKGDLFRRVSICRVLDHAVEVLLCEVAEGGTRRRTFATRVQVCRIHTGLVAKLHGQESHTRTGTVAKIITCKALKSFSKEWPTMMVDWSMMVRRNAWICSNRTSTVSSILGVIPGHNIRQYGGKLRHGTSTRVFCVVVDNGVVWLHESVEDDLAIQ